MITYKITKVKKWMPEELGYFFADNHNQAMSQVNKEARRIYNNRFREIEYTGEYYQVTSFSNVTFVYEIAGG